jgi:toxin YoeB
MKVIWADMALADYHHWQTVDVRIAKRIEQLIADIKATPFAGIGKPEPLRHQWTGYWSRRITGEHRLVYRVAGDPPALTIAQCRYHY